MKTVLQELLGFFKEDSSNSMTRLVLWMAHIITWPVWAFLCFTRHEMVDLPTGLLAMHAGLMGGKLYQKHIETTPTTLDQPKDSIAEKANG